MEDCWYYNELCLEEPPEGYYGFIYRITKNGKVYYGKKAFVHNKKSKVTKKEIKETGTRKRVKRTQIDSNWKNYYGSSKDFLEYLNTWGGKPDKREIIRFCKDRASLAYWEVAILIEVNALFDPNCFNGNILGKFFKGKIHE